MKKCLLYLALLLAGGSMIGAEPTLDRKARAEAMSAPFGTRVDVLSRAEKAYSTGLICYASGDMDGAEKYFAQAVRFDPKMDKAANALKQVRTERELEK